MNNRCKDCGYYLEDNVCMLESEPTNDNTCEYIQIQDLYKRLKFQLEEFGKRINILE